jgi:hypothetical protein
MSAAMTIITSSLAGKSRSFWGACSVAGILLAAVSVEPVNPADAVAPVDPVLPAEARGAAAVADLALAVASAAGCWGRWETPGRAGEVAVAVVSADEGQSACGGSCSSIRYAVTGS